MSSPGTDALDALRDIWREQRTDVLARVDELHGAVAAALEGSLDEARREAATRQAHMLAGSAGTFGFNVATDHARRLEQALRAPDGPPQDELPALAETVRALRRELARQDVLGGAAVEYDELRRVDLLIVGRADRAQRLADEADERGLRTASASSLEQAREIVERRDPSLVLLHLDVADDAEAALAFLDAASDRRPVLVVVDPDAAVDRLEVAQRGGRGFLPSTLDDAQTLEETLGVRERLRRRGTRVLIVDDDAAIREAVEMVLVQAGLEVHVSDGSDDVWALLERTEPDLVVLDIDLGHGRSGIELCRAMRADRRWATVPAVVLSARSDRDTVTEVFASGADDYVPKPFVGPELVARIVNRLERVRLFHELAARDHLTGLATRGQGSELLEGLRAQAHRTGESFCLAVIDCDDFKRINDGFGHAMGDAVLQMLSSTLQRSFGAEDAVARWGGDEFVVGMHGMPVQDARERLGRVLEEVAQRRVHVGDQQATVRLSAGLALYPNDGDNVPALLRAADDGLYAAKQAGGNRVTMASTARGGSVSVDVAIVDDDPALVAVLEHALEARGYTHHHVGDGLEAAAAIAAARPEVVASVILLDWDLPGIDGLALLRRMEENGTLARTRVIMLTGRASEDEVLAALDAGAIDHVAKPFSTPVLMQRVRHALAR